MFFICFANKILILPSLLFKDIKGDGIFIYILGFLLDLGLLFIFIKLKKTYENLSFFQILSKNFTKFTAIFIYTIGLIFFFMKFLLTFNVTIIYFKQKIYPDGNILLFLVCFLPIVTHAVLIGLRSIGRCGQFFFLIVLLGFLSCYFISLTNYNSMPILFDTTILKFSTTMLKNSFAFGDFVILFFMMDKIELKNKDVKKLAWLSVLGSALATALMVSFFVIYQNTAFLYPSAISDIISVNTSFTRIGQIELFAMFIVAFITFYQLIIYAYCFNEAFTHLFKIKDWASMLWFNLIFIFVSYFIFNSIERVVFLAQTLSLYLGALPYVLVPLFGILALFLGGKHEKDV